MKEMYLKVGVENNDNGFLDVYYRDGMCFMCHKDNEKLVEIEDAESKGAEKLCKAISDICHSDDELVQDAFDGYCTYAGIIGKFTPKEIIRRAEKLNAHVPTVGDVYRSRHTNISVVVLSFNKETRETRYIAPNFASCEKEDYFNEHYCFTGENIDVSALVNKIGLN